MAFSLQNFIRTTQTRDGSPRFVITLSAPASALIAAILIVIVAWCFFMGFMVGRGQNPEKHLEEIAAIVGQAKTDDAGAPQGDAKPGDAATAGEQNGENAQAKDKSQPDAQASPDGQPDQGTGDQQAADAAASDTRTGAQAPLKDAIRQQPKKPDPAQTGEPVFIYTYRLATVKTQEAAKSEQKRYQSKGVQCVIRKLNSSFSLNMTLRGTEKDDAALRQKLKSAGLGAPMLLSKKKR